LTTLGRPARAFRGSDVLVALAVAVLYIACAKLGLALAFRAAQVTAVWPPTGFALAAVLRLGWRSVPGILLGAFVANATADEPLWVAAGVALGNTLEAITGALLLWHFGFDGRLARVRDVIALLGALAVCPLVSATIGVASLGAGHVQPLSSLPGLWWLWWLGDALGGLIVAPLLLAWTAGERIPARRGALLELAVLMGGLAAASTIVFTRMPQLRAMEYVVFPFLIWAGLRTGPAGSATAVVTTNAIAVWGTHIGRGPFAGAGAEQGLVPLQIFMAIAATTGLLLGAAISELRLRARELAEADRRKDEFLAMLGHELRNPLAPILHAVDLLGDEDDKVSEQARDAIRRQSQHLARLVDDLLDVSRISRGTVQLERRPVTLAELVANALDTWRHLIEKRRQQLSVDIPSRPIWLDVDPTRFTQVIANLVHNATKFTSVGGRISITGSEEDGSVVLRVRDNGEGMSAELQSRAFELFVQGPPSLDRPHGGLGLGLTLVRRLVELHGGTVEVSSEGFGKGSEFTVRMPLAEAPGQAVPAAIEPSRPAQARSRRVLIVEDNPDAREILKHVLVRAGHEVRTAEDGPQALAEAENFLPEVVLLDIGLPGMDGYALARRLRAMPQSSGAMLVAVTGYGQAEDRALSREAGFDHHLLKPVDRATLLELLR
jgi:signal transduction histidine kinase/CheY-like chemotaxis protein